MAVLLPDRSVSATVYPHTFGRDAMGSPVRDTTPVVRGPYPGAARELVDGSWTLRVDTRLWPLREDDELSDGTSTWVVRTATVNKVPGHSDVDYVAVTATLQPPRPV